LAARIGVAPSVPVIGRAHLVMAQVNVLAP
jgi:hypothetical protein